MKNIILTIVVTLFSTLLSNGQEALDYFGNPQENATVDVFKTAHHNKTSRTNTTTIINAIPSPNESIADIAFDGKHLWVEGYNLFLLYQISIVDGSIIRSIPTSVKRPYGLTFDGTHLWLADADNKIIQQIDTANGNVIHSFPTPADLTKSYPGGLSWGGNSLWYNDSKGSSTIDPGDSTFNIDTKGETLQGYEAKGNYPSGLAFDGQYLWSTDNDNDEIYKIDISTFLVIDTITAPGGKYPNGLAFDGQHLWLANNDSDSLYQIDISSLITGINNSNHHEDEVTIYPNPATNQITIDNELLSIKNIEITNQIGQVIKSVQTNSNTINISDLPLGIYFIQLVTDDQRIIKRFTKQ